VAERARVRELILTHYLTAEPEAVAEKEWAERAGSSFSGVTTAGTDGLRRELPRARPPQAPQDA
jgi:ribonuclease BN (tRNA processing enzyme)